MNKKDVIEHFGSVRAVAAALGISLPAIYQWGEIVPANRWYEIEIKSGGALKAPTAMPQKKVA